MRKLCVWRGIALMLFVIAFGLLWSSNRQGLLLPDAERIALGLPVQSYHSVDQLAHYAVEVEYADVILTGAFPNRLAVRGFADHSGAGFLRWPDDPPN